MDKSDKVKDMYIENYNILLLRKIKIYVNRDIYCSLVWRLKIVNVAISCKLTYTFSALLIKSQQFFFCRNWQADSKIYMEMQRT